MDLEVWGYYWQVSETLQKGLSAGVEEALTANERSNDRYHSLDALRGLAALIVVLMHFHDLLFGKERRLHLSHLKLILLYLASPFRSGASAVALFFVLSGFVLALPILNGRHTSYAVYASRRIIRIYIPYIAALAFSIWGCFRFHGQLPNGMWPVPPWAAPPTASAIVNHLLFLGTYAATFNFVFWTLIIELRVSLLYPFLVKAMTSLRVRTAFGIVSAALGVMTILALYYPASDLLETLRYSCFFAIGLFIAWQREPIRRWYGVLSKRSSAMLLLITLAVFGYGIALRFPAPVLDLFCLISGASLILAALHNRRLKTLLERSIPQFLGQISYSLYLIHLPILFALYVWVGKRLSTFPFLAFYLAAAISGATLFYALIERPCILLSRRLVARA